MFFVPMKINSRLTSERLPLVNLLVVLLMALAYFFVPIQSLWVGPGTGLFSVLTYAFAHHGIVHLILNSWMLWLFGNAVNRRIGDGWYAAACVISVLALGILARLLVGGYLYGASGLVFSLVAMTAILMPASRIEVHYLIFFPITLLVGLLKKPAFELFWIVRWGRLEIVSLSALIIVPILEFIALCFGGLNCGLRELKRRWTAAMTIWRERRLLGGASTNN